MDNQIAIVQFLFTNNWKILSDSLGANPALTAHKFMTAADLLKFCATEQNCLVMVNISSKDDLIQLATFVKNSRKVLKNTVLKIVVVNATENKQFEKAIAKLGNVDILEPSVNVKALRFKMDFWMKTMRGQAKKLGALNQKTIEASVNEGSAESKTLIHSPPLDCENDIWILSRESDCKKIIGRWMVKFMGPGPYVGQWNDVPNKPSLYSFQIKKAFSEEFISGEGNWLFKGDQKPEFNWQENRWMFTGDTFELFFYDGKNSHSRVKYVDKVLTIAGNSLFARTKESLILNSFDKDLVFKSEAESIRDQSLEFENEGDLGGHLSGKVKDKETSGKAHFQGKSKDQESGKGNLSGKIKDSEEVQPDLEGKVKDREESQKDLHGKVKDQEEISGHLSGEIKDKEEAKKDLSGSVKPVNHNESSPESEAKKGSDQGDIGGNWNGKVSPSKDASDKKTEEHNQHNEKLSSNWGGKVKEQAPEEKSSQKKRESFTDNVSTPDLKGRSESTDKLEKSWGGKGGPDSISTKGAEAPSTGEHKDGSLLDLKKTEKEHQTHYKNHNEAQQYEADEARRNQYKDGTIGAMGGSTSTDKIASHYGSGKTSKTNDVSKDPLSGEGDTDRIPTHVGRKNRDRNSEETSEDETSSPPLYGKGKTEKLKGHYGSGSKSRSDNSSEPEDNVDKIIDELEASNRLNDFEAENVLPFRPAEEKDLEKLTESGKVSSHIIQNSKKYECQLDDYFDNNAIFVCKGEGLRNSEKAFIDIALSYQSQVAKINCEGQVMSIDQDGSGGFFVTVEVSPKDAKMFDTYMTLLKSRQQNIASFMMKAKGL